MAVMRKERAVQARAHESVRTVARKGGELWLLEIHLLAVCFRGARCFTHTSFQPWAASA